jgi:hypothetical protein
MTIEEGKLAAIECKHCFRPMPLPPAEHPHPERPSWPHVYRYFPFLCPVCGHAYAYSARDIAPKEPAQINLDEDGSPRKIRNVIRIIIPCWSETCREKGNFQRGNVLVDTLLPFDLDLPKFLGDPNHRKEYYNANLWMEAEKLICGGNCIAHGIPCSNGCSNGSETTGEAIRIDDPRTMSAMLDKEWKALAVYGQ